MTTTSLRSRAATYLHDAARGVRRAPVEVIATLCVALGFSWAIEADGGLQAWAELAVACVLLLVVAWTATLLAATGKWDARRRWAFTLGGGLAVAIYGIAVADFERAAEHWRAGLLVVTAVLWFFALPAFVGSSTDRVARMRRVDGRILLRMIGALLYGGALFAGLALALGAVNALFELDLDGKIYAHVFGWIFFVLVPWIVLGGLPDYVRPAEDPTGVARVAHRIALWLVPPLLAIYYLILYAYVARIFITGEIPKNLVSPLVLAAGGLATLGLLVFDPRPAVRGLARGLRLGPPLFLPLAVLGVRALTLRIEQYGLTEFRLVRLVVLVALVALAVGATVQLVRRRAFTLHAALLGLAAVLLAAAIGPWSVMALSRHSQQTRLEASLVAVGIDPSDTGARPAPGDTSLRIVPAAEYEQIRSSAGYLAAHFGPEALPPALRPTVEIPDARWRDYAVELGLQPDALPAGERFARGGSLPFDVPLDVPGGTAYRIAWSPPPSPHDSEHAPVPIRGEPGQRRGDVAVSLADSTRLALRFGERVLHAELGPLIASMEPLAMRPMREPMLPAGEAVVDLTDAAGAARGRLVVWNLWMHADTSGTRIDRLEGLALIPGD